MRVLDPACGSGNFLYVALQNLKDLEHEVVTFAELVGAPGLRLVGPRQFHGIEVNPFAHELASMVIWIGYLQWNEANGVSNQQTPILEPLENIRLHDALMNEDGTEYAWPEAEYIVGNPPFLGSQRMRAELGDTYVHSLRALFSNRLAGQSDFVCYWLEKARAHIANRVTLRVGLIATNSIRGGANREVLKRILDTGGVFMAWSDEQWILDGAAVRVSIVGFDNGSDRQRWLNGQPVHTISPSLTTGSDMSAARKLPANEGKAYQGPVKIGPFEIDGELARSWLSLPNPAGVRNLDVLRPYLNGKDILDRSRGMWIVDFGSRSKAEAEQYVAPFAYIEQYVLPLRSTNRRELRRRLWWRHGELGTGLKQAVEGMQRYLATPRVAKHRVFVWVNARTFPDSAVVVIAECDDYTFGILHSRIHEVWSIAQGTSLGVGNDPRYTPSTTFETFPFPEPAGDLQIAVADAARHLDELRSYVVAADTALTLTKLYNEVTALKENRDATARAFPLLIAHERLDEAVAAAYGWQWPLSDDDVLARLLALNLESSST